MKLPAYFHEVPPLRLQDPLAELLGCADDGILEYRFGDVVRLTGHACPTVASAYWLTWLALEELYPDSLPQRGAIRVEFREDARFGNTGVVAAVIQMLTGAAGGSGFKGIGGRFSRAWLMRYAPDLLLSMRFTRLDTREAVEAAADHSLVPVDPTIERLLNRAVAGQATPLEASTLAQLWQQRVRHLLVDLARDTGVYMLRRVGSRQLATCR